MQWRHLGLVIYALDTESKVESRSDDIVVIE